MSQVRQFCPKVNTAPHNDIPPTVAGKDDVTGPF
jgi:hypothetical protein